MSPSTWRFSLLLVGAGALAAAVAAAPQTDDWTEEQLRTLRGMSTEALGPPPADPTNRVADNPRAARLGASLFADRRMSSNGAVSCATCHEPARDFTDRTPTAHGVGIGTRRTMPITPALYSPWQFWDGRADSLWAQALGPVENPLEHDFSRGEVFDLVRTRYLAEYEATFGPLPAFRAGRASPLGENAAQLRWKRLGASRQGAVNTVLVNVGKAIAAFERRQTVPGTQFDRYVRWLSAGRKGPSPLNREAVAGLKLFIGKGRCATCHSGPMLTNNEFANTGVPDPRRDRGRQLGLGQALRDPFNCRGVFNDALRTNCDELDFAPVGGPEAVGAFKVPSLRGVAQRAPYMHAGQFVSLDGVLRHYESAPVAQVGKSQLRPVSFTPPDRRALIAFLQSLDP